MRLWPKMFVAGMLLAGRPSLALDSLATYDDEDDVDPNGQDGDLDMAPQVPLAAAFTLKPAVETAQARLFLGELAACAGSAKICSEAYAIDLGSSPEPGRTVLWHRDKVLSILAKEWPGAQLQMRGAKSSKVTSSSVLLEEARIAAELKSRLDPADAAAGSVQFVIDHVSLPTAVKVRPGELWFEFPDLSAERLTAPAARSLSGNQRLTVVCRSKTATSDEPGQTFVINAQLSVKERRWLTSRSLAKGTVLQSDDVKHDWVTVVRGHTHEVSEATQLIGHRLRRDLTADSALMTTDVESPRLLKRGQMATLQLKNGGLHVTSQVRILADATAEQPVEAVYLNTKKKLRVRAIDSHTVQLAF